jgi:hypothetical protein
MMDPAGRLYVMVLSPKPKPCGTLVIGWLLSITRGGTGGQIPVSAGCSPDAGRAGVPATGGSVCDGGFPGISGFVVQPAVIEMMSMSMIPEPMNSDLMCL